MNIYGNIKYLKSQQKGDIYLYKKNNDLNEFYGIRDNGIQNNEILIKKKLHQRDII